MIKKEVPLVSVIVTVYNTESWLEECLDSITCQTLHEIEIICVDDGSTDRSSEILEVKAGTDNRINVFVPKHEGMVCQIDFSEFNVQYSSTSYGNKSTFRIYAGQGTGGELLWELNDNEIAQLNKDRKLYLYIMGGSMPPVYLSVRPELVSTPPKNEDPKNTD